MSPEYRNAAEELIIGRRSVRAFNEMPVPRRMVEGILTTAARSPSGTNMQPWRVYVITGAARDQLISLVQAKRAAEPEREQSPPFGEYTYNPEPLPEPYKSRRSTVGWNLYKILGVAKGDRAASWRAAGRNFEFFGAPVGLIFTIDRYLTQGSWLDLGIFLQSIMIAARGAGLDTCCQAAWRHYHDVVRQVVGIPNEELLVCGMSLGYALKEAPANQLQTEREPVESFARFVDVPADGSTPTRAKP